MCLMGVHGVCSCSYGWCLFMCFFVFFLYPKDILSNKASQMRKFDRDTEKARTFQCLDSTNKNENIKIIKKTTQVPLEPPSTSSGAAICRPSLGRSSSYLDEKAARGSSGFISDSLRLVGVSSVSVSVCESLGGLPLFPTIQRWIRHEERRTAART